MKMKIYYTYIYRSENALFAIENVNIQRTKEHFERPVKIHKIETKTNSEAKNKLFLEDNFMRTKRQISRNHGGKSLPPEILYFVVEPKYAKLVIDKGITAPKGKLLLLCETTTQTLLLCKKCHILKVDSAKMYKNGIKFSYHQKRDMWCTQSIQSRYITLLI